MQFLKLQLELSLSGGKKTGEPLLSLSAPWSTNESNQKSSFLNAISLINVEEEKVFKTQQQLIIKNKEKKFFTRKEPDVKLNLFILISSYNKNYEDALKFLSKVIGFFQQQNVFQREQEGKVFYDDLPETCDRLIVELYNVAFEQQNQIWASLSTGYVPSVVYKVKTLIIDSLPGDKEERLIEKIGIESKHVQSDAGKIIFSRNQ